MNSKLTKTDIVKMIIENEEELDLIDEDIMHLLINEKISKDVNKEHYKSLSLGDKMADRLASFAGSWFFIIIFMSTLFMWIIVNILFLKKPFDPFPFILLNLILSCVAAIQAPVIMMSQNRQEEKDRIRSKNDYKVNLKSELIVEDLHCKIDQFIINQEQIIERLSQLENTQKLKEKTVE